MKKQTPKPTWTVRNTQTKTEEKHCHLSGSWPVANVPPNALMDSVTTAPSSELPVQPKLTIGQVGDQYEQEADAVATKVVQQINTPSSDAAQAKEEEQVQLKPALQRQDLGGGTAAPELESEINHAKGGGQALDKGLQRSMGNAMGMDLSHVKVHTDNTSHQLNQALQAKAFTTGQDVFFGKGQYQPGSKSGQELIAHELTHVGQQTGSGIQRKARVVQCEGNGLASISNEMVQDRQDQKNQEITERVNCIVNYITDNKDTPFFMVNNKRFWPCIVSWLEKIYSPEFAYFLKSYSRGDDLGDIFDLYVDSSSPYQVNVKFITQIFKKGKKSFTQNDLEAIKDSVISYLKLTIDDSGNGIARISMKLLNYASDAAGYGMTQTRGRH